MVFLIEQDNLMTGTGQAMAECFCALHSAEAATYDHNSRFNHVNIIHESQFIALSSSEELKYSIGIGPKG